MGNMMDDLMKLDACGICHLPIGEIKIPVELPEGTKICHPVCAEFFESSRPHFKERQDRLKDLG